MEAAKETSPSLSPAVAAKYRVLVESGALPLPLLPEVATRVLALADQGTCDAARLAAEIKRDQSLSGHLFRVASSPMYAMRSRALSLQQVVQRIGFASTRQIALLAASRASLFHVPGFEAEVREAFRHALVTALFAQEIARMRRGSVEEAFTAGLLHDVGRALLLQVLVDVHRELGDRVDRRAAMAAVDADHARVSGALVEKWGMSARICEAVQRHHEPAGSEPATIIALADALAHASPPDSPAAALPLAGELHIYRDDLDALARRGEAIRATAEELA